MKGLEDACKTTPEGVANACGIHIHEGKTCDDASAVGGHYFATDSDPWSPLGYNSLFGYARGSVKAAIGDGEIFLVVQSSSMTAQVAEWHAHCCRQGWKSTRRM